VFPCLIAGERSTNKEIAYHLVVSTHFCVSVQVILAKLAENQTIGFKNLHKVRKSIRNAHIASIQSVEEDCGELFAHLSGKRLRNYGPAIHNPVFNW
jgi:hypothetical protein